MMSNEQDRIKEGRISCRTGCRLSRIGRRRSRIGFMMRRIG